MNPFILKEPLIGNTNKTIARIRTTSIQWPYSMYQFRDVRVDYKHIFLAVSTRWSHRNPSAARKLQPPIHHLPVELIGQIFEIHLQIDMRYHEEIRDGRPTCRWDPLPFISTHPLLGSSPMVLGQVCGYWRDVALSMLTLWSSICIECPLVHTEGLLRTLDLSLKRSGESPLTIQLRSASLVHNAGVDKALSLLIPQIHRWKRIFSHL